jgi:hypothetical protein
MRTGLPEEATGSLRQEDCLDSPGRDLLGAIDVQANLDTISETYEVIRKAVGLFGKRSVLAMALGEALDYEAHIANGLNRRNDRHAFIDWLIPLLKHPSAGALIVEWICAVAGYDRPLRRRPPSDAQKYRALLQRVIASGEAGEDLLRRAATDLGVDVGSLKL